MGYSRKWTEILNQVKDYGQNKGFVYYRGHSNSNFKLNSGLFREYHNSIEDYSASERMKYNHFKTLGHLEHGERSWDLLYVMQHYGVRTRLLDWSESFNTALFFAYINWDPMVSSACVWMLNPGPLNSYSLGKPYLLDPNTEFGDYEHFIFDNNKHAHSVAIYPPKNSKRMVAQQGVFTIQGDSMNPLEDEFNGELVRNGHLIKITLDLDIIDDIRMYLWQSGVNYYTQFPDLEGLAKYINDPLLAPPNINKLLSVYPFN